MICACGPEPRYGAACGHHAEMCRDYAKSIHRPAIDHFTMKTIITETIFQESVLRRESCEKLAEAIIKAYETYRDGTNAQQII